MCAHSSDLGSQAVVLLFASQRLSLEFLYVARVGHPFVVLHDSPRRSKGWRADTSLSHLQLVKSGNSPHVTSFSSANQKRVCYTLGCVASSTMHGASTSDSPMTALFAGPHPPPPNASEAEKIDPRRRPEKGGVVSGHVQLAGGTTRRTTARVP